MANGMGGLAAVLKRQLHSIARDSRIAKESEGRQLPDKRHPLLASVVWQLRLMGCLFRTSSRKCGPLDTVYYESLMGIVELRGANVCWSEKVEPGTLGWV